MVAFEQDYGTFALNYNTENGTANTVESAQVISNISQLFGGQFAPDNVISSDNDVVFVVDGIEYVWDSDDVLTPAPAQYQSE